jgi:hypothetical protein
LFLEPCIFNICVKTQQIHQLFIQFINFVWSVAYPEIFSGGGGGCQDFFSGGGVQQIQLRTEGRENGDLAP